MTPDDPDGRPEDRTDGGAFQEPTRRSLMAGAAGTVAAGGFVTFAVGGQGGEPLDPAETIVLGGQIEGWQGRDPASISGEVNPTLTLQQGETYDLTWINVDGAPHNVAFLDGDGSVLRRTEIVDQQGAEQSISFTATGNHETYLCQVHPDSMRGSIEVAGGQQTPVPQPEPAAVPAGPEVGVRRIAGEPLSQPTSFAAVRIDGAQRLFVVDQTGEIYRLTGEGPREFLDISPHVVVQNEGFDERGMLGLAFHPNFQQNRRLFVRYSSYPRQEELPEDYDHVFLLSEFQAAEDFATASPDSETVLLEIPEPQFNHNAGDLAFGPDGLLYVPVGDGGGADDTGVGHVSDWYQPNDGGNGQDVTENLLGSVLRIDVDAQQGERPYGIPGDNPLVGREGLDEIYAWGFRNPWRVTFDGDRLIVADVGQNLFEEIDVVERGGNYGWNVREGFHCFSTENPNESPGLDACPTSAPDLPPFDGQPLATPVLEYPHTVGERVVGLSVTGGHVYGGNQLENLAGRYVFGDWSASFRAPRGRLWVADLPAQGEAQPFTRPAQGQPQFPMQELVVAGSGDGELHRTILAFGRDLSGELYVLASDTTTIDGTGEVYQIVPPGEGDQISPPGTPTPAGTETGTPTGTPAGTGTATGTATGTGTAPPTETPTGTEAGAGTPTGTENGTPTGTQSPTETG